MKSKITNLLVYSLLLVLAATAQDHLVRTAHAEVSSSTFDLEGFGKLPITDQGRVKPISRYARNQLMLLSGKGKLKRTDAAGEVKRISPVRWYLDVLTRRDVSVKDQVFRIDHPEVLGLMDLTNKHKDGGHRKMFSIADIEPHFQKLDKEARQASETDADKRTRYQVNLLQLYRRLQIYISMSQKDKPFMIPPTEEALKKAETEDIKATWTSLKEQSQLAHSGGKVNPAARTYQNLFDAYEKGEVSEFNTVLSQYQATLESQIPGEVKRANLESIYRKIDPLFISLMLYLICFMVLMLALIQQGMNAKGAASKTIACSFIIATLSFIIHSIGLYMRMEIEKRPPVTTLYSSAIFVGWGAALVGVLMCGTTYYLSRWSEELKRLVQIFSLLLVGVIGLISMIVANNQLGPGEEDMVVMRAVLDTNFWLATHVVTITLGYAATFLAGAGGLIFIALGLTTTLLTKEAKRVIGSLIYGTTCFAVLLSLIGTVLGGIWADQSWGRFWGWDPKENGAIMIVIWTSLILHARWAGIVRERGIAVLAVVGNIVTAWSWFGTNQLGIGLHSYGFTDSATFYTVLFGLTQMFIMAAGLIPLSAWRCNMLDSAARSRPWIFPGLAYCNFAYGFIVSLGLFVSFSMVSLSPLVVIYLLIACVILSFLLYYSSRGLLTQSWFNGFLVSHVFAVATLAHIVWLCFGRPGLWQIIGDTFTVETYAAPTPKLIIAYGWITISLAYPILLLLFVNLQSRHFDAKEQAEKGESDDQSATKVPAPA